MYHHVPILIFEYSIQIHIYVQGRARKVNVHIEFIVEKCIVIRRPDFMIVLYSIWNLFGYFIKQHISLCLDFIFEEYYRSRTLKRMDVMERTRFYTITFPTCWLQSGMMLYTIHCPDFIVQQYIVRGRGSTWREHDVYIITLMTRLYFDIPGEITLSGIILDFLANSRPIYRALYIGRVRILYRTDFTLIHLRFGFCFDIPVDNNLACVPILLFNSIS